MTHILLAIKVFGDQPTIKVTCDGVRVVVYESVSDKPASVNDVATKCNPKAALNGWRVLEHGGQYSEELLQCILKDAVTQAPTAVEDALSYVRRTTPAFDEILTKINKLDVQQQVLMTKVDDLSSSIQELRSVMTGAVAIKEHPGGGDKYLEFDVGHVSLSDVSVDSGHHTDEGSYLVSGFSGQNELTSGEIRDFCQLFNKPPDHFYRVSAALGYPAGLPEPYRYRIRRMLHHRSVRDKDHDELFVARETDIESGLFFLPTNHAVISPERQELQCCESDGTATVTFTRRAIFGKWRWWVPVQGGRETWTHDTRVGTLFLGVITYDFGAMTGCIELSYYPVGVTSVNRREEVEFLIFGRTSLRILNAIRGKFPDNWRDDRDAEVGYGILAGTKKAYELADRVLYGVTDTYLEMEEFHVARTSRWREAVSLAVGLILSKAPANLPERACARLVLTEPETRTISETTMDAIGATFTRISHSSKPENSTHGLILGMLSDNFTEIELMQTVGTLCAQSQQRLLNGCLLDARDRLIGCGLSEETCNQILLGQRRGMVVLEYCARILPRLRAGGRHTSYNGRLNTFVNFEGQRWSLCPHCGSARTDQVDRQACEAYDMLISGLGRGAEFKSEFARVTPCLAFLMPHDRSATLGRLKIDPRTSDASVRIGREYDGMRSHGGPLIRALVREDRFGNHSAFFSRQF